MGRSAPAALPPPLGGLDPQWSRLVSAYDAHGTGRTWHVLDSHAGDRAAEQVRLVLLCVHGNPTWSYLWRRLLAQAPAGIRVIAVDQLDMGWSERTGVTRRLADRVSDLAGLVDALEIQTPIVTVAHDWGGPVSLGWAVEHVDRLAGVILTNTAVHQPAGSPAPTLIRIVRSRPLLSLMTVHTRAFLRGTLALSRRATGHGVGPEAQIAFLAPYATPDRRRGIGTFVADIPLRAAHPSAAALAAITEGLERLRDVPTLLLWGPEDPVFSDLYLRDLRTRLPRADVHRYEGAGHLVVEDAPAAVDDLLRWAQDLLAGVTPDRPSAPAVGGRIWSALEARADDGAVAIIECGRDRRTTWAGLATRVEGLARGLSSAGIHRGDRVALLIRPGIDLITCAYACWRIGAVIVVADSGLGLRGMRRALRGAAPRHVIGVPAGLLLARSLRIPGRHIAVRALEGLVARGRALPLPTTPMREDDAVVAFTSGATGPAKGVVYRHDQLEAQRDAIVGHYGLTARDALVAAFAPFAVLGPALGIASAVPDMDVTAPRTLTARALAQAADAISGTIMWSSPAALTNVVATSEDLDDAGRRALAGLRTVMVAGAPVRPSLLRAAAHLMPAARLTTPYGMTEALPLTEASLAEIDAVTAGRGVLVGAPLPGVHITIDPLTPDSTTGEVIVTADHVKDRYDQLWATQTRTAVGSSHRTGDVGHLDDQGRLWIEGRLGHVLHTASGAVTPVAIEQAVESIEGVVMAACVGVGPAGTAVPVVVITTDPGVRRSRLIPQSVAGISQTGGAGVADGTADGADDGLSSIRSVVREWTGVEVAAVLAVPHLPVDIRHNSKLDRARIAAWAERALAGGRMGRP